MAGFHGLGRSPERRCMPLAEWPAYDRERWLAATRNGDIFDEAGVRSSHRPVSNRKMELGYGRFLTFLIRQGSPLGGSAADTVDRNMVVAYVQELRKFGNASATVLGRLQELHDTLVSINPGQDWSWIRDISAWVRGTASRGNEKRQKMVEAHELLGLGLHLIQCAKQIRIEGQAAIEFRDGLVIALLALRPLRLRNLVGLELGRTLLRQGKTYRIRGTLA
jgi:hypothetical protein